MIGQESPHCHILISPYAGWEFRRVTEIQYPERARRASLEGRVAVVFIIDKNGYVRFPTVTQGLGAGCDEEVLRVVQLARFLPGQLNGTPVNVITSLTVSSY